ncbi:MAG TPA: methylmalonyl Co-A mutase-associated GTPase MeaB [Bacillota bacterium]|nr:methylmalonyl Co-A mutase-associated GTPase MeaB [Bacillota bacterium]
MSSNKEWIQHQDIRALARGITMIENDHPDKLSLLSEIFSKQTDSIFVGITGSPGAGKSSLVNRLITKIRSVGKTVAVIAVDPTSPYSGGALLGDRVRMHEHYTDDGVFIRSMATRGSLGGLARGTKDVMRACAAFGFDVVIVETVGVGQSELDIMKVVDTTAVVLTPNSGDILQIFKAGIMEIADVFVINKADIPGVVKLRRLLRELVMMTESESKKTDIVETVATENRGIDTLWEKIEAHQTFLQTTEEGQEKRKTQRTYEIYELIREEIWRDVTSFIENEQLKDTIASDDDPYEKAKAWYTLWKERGDAHG